MQRGECGELFWVDIYSYGLAADGIGALAPRSKKLREKMDAALITLMVG